MKYKKGESGNPTGRPKGSLNKTTLIVQKLLASEAEEITRQVIEIAKEGDLQACKLILERLVPPAKDGPVEIKLPEISRVEDILKGFTEVSKGLATGMLTPTQAKTVGDILEQHRKSIESRELEQRIEQLEESVKKNSAKRR